MALQYADLIQKMTLEEKASQLRYDAPAIPRLLFVFMPQVIENLLGLAAIFIVSDECIGDEEQHHDS